MLSEGRGETPAPPLLQGIILSRMASTSINIQPCKVGSSEQHNQRTKSLDYVRSELSHLNEHWQSDDKTLSQHLSEVQRAYQEAKGKKMHAKATPIREGVIVIQQSTTIDDLQRFARACEERWGIKALQIHTHKDEGYMHAKEWTPNLHAHIVWRWTDDNGVTRKLNRFDMVEMQTLLQDQKRETERAKTQLEETKELVKSKTSELRSLAWFTRSFLDSSFETFKDEAQSYFRVKFKQVLELSSLVLMWAGNFIKDKLGNRYTADQENERLLINGKTIEQHEGKTLNKMLEDAVRQREQQPTSRGLKR